MNTKKISEYYDTVHPFYRVRFGKSYGFHAPLYKPETKSRKEAILNLNKFLAEKASIKDGDYILDSGCGVGGSCIWLVNKYNVKTVGITISKKQFLAAKYLAKKMGIADKTRYFLMNYQKTNFKDNQFDVVWAIESSCYAEDKLDFLKEARRILKKNGRLIVADAILERKPKGEKENKLMEKIYDEFALENFAIKKSFLEDLKKAKFKKMKCWDITTSIHLNKNYFYQMIVLFAFFAEKLNLTPKSLTDTLRASIHINESIKTGILKYKVFYAEK